MNGAIVGVLLAGGLSRRMGGRDKMLRRIGGETILSRVIARMAPQTRSLLLNANGDPARFAAFGLPVAPDTIEGHAGPLAGVLTGMEWAATHAPDCPWVLTAPTDAPFLPDNFAARMLAAVDAQRADMACASSGGRSHPVCGLWPVRLAAELRHAMTEEHIRKVDVWTARYKHAVVDWPTDPVDPFFNANRPEDLTEAERLLDGTVR
ncbi:MAG: molybdenum cofactor guanylyltransferase MobA [Alphaproteobacteria bacterium]|nr:molybdenum cofactor guanylyltransferase MobA [Alphaproteobacteria bacterium]